MKLIKFFAMAMSVAGVVTLSSCLDYDDPEDTFQSNELKLDDKVFHGNVDSINYDTEYTKAQMDSAAKHMNHELGAFIGAQQLILGGKINGGGVVESPTEHSYQFHSTVSDIYAQYSVIPHSKFDFGDEIRASYHVSRGWNAGANGTFVMTKNYLTPLMNHPSADTIPELKALALLFYSFAAVRNTDLYGPMPYQEFKVNKQHAPFKYDTQEFIYKRVVENINTFVACYKRLRTKSDEYKDYIKDKLESYAGTLNTRNSYNIDTEIDKWIRLANSLKLRMAMHIVKRDKNLAKQWAEEAVRDGVIVDRSQEFYMPSSSMNGHHPLSVIGGDSWKDFAPSASFVTLLKSFKHPYVNDAARTGMLLFDTNNGEITSKDGTVTRMGADIIGIRSGSKVGAAKGTENPYISFSRYSSTMLTNAPIYLFKLAEVCFLRAEGVLRGWNVGKGKTAQQWYEDGVKNSLLFTADDSYTQSLTSYLEEYLELEKPVEVVYVDPTGRTPKETSRTTIGVKWDDSDSQEVKLEKIITQKYIALFPNGFEAWGEMRRTGYPKLFPVLTRYNDGSLNPGDLVRRMVFPNDDQASIADIQTSGLDALGGPDQQGTRLWWDVQTPSNF